MLDLKIFSLKVKRFLCRGVLLVTIDIVTMRQINWAGPYIFGLIGLSKALIYYICWFRIKGHLDIYLILCWVPQTIDNSEFEK